MQVEYWKSEFGIDYTERNYCSLEEMNLRYIKRYGISRESMNEFFVGDLPRNLTILEIGANVGMQISLLKSMGFNHLFALDVNIEAINILKINIPSVDVLLASAEKLPFKDKSFDIVFTSGLLIHISPDIVHTVIKEILRCSKKYIWGFEYFNKEYTHIKYRGEDNLLWKANFPDIIVSLSNNAVIKKIKYYPYINQNDLIDVMYLITLGKNEF